MPLKKFYKAEDYHQEYYDNHPNQPYCQVVIAPKLEKMEKEKVIQADRRRPNRSRYAEGRACDVLNQIERDAIAVPVSNQLVVTTYSPLPIMNFSRSATRQL